MSRGRISGLLALWLGAPAVLLVLFLGEWIIAFFGWRSNHLVVQEWAQGFIVRQLLPNGVDIFHATGWMYAILAIAFAITAVLCLPWWTNVYGRSYLTTEVLSPGWTSIAVVASLAGALSVVGLASAVNDNAKDEGRGYASQTVFVVEDLSDPPSSLRRLLEGARPGDGERCNLRGRHDVPSCIVAGELPTDWEPRVASLAGARQVMRRTSAAIHNTTLMSESFTYLYGEDGSGRWSAVRDGKNSEPLYGVVEWDGQGHPTECRFDGAHSIDRAFGGRWSNNLRDLLADRYPSLLFEDRDLWGHCEGEEPVVVIPVTRQVGFHHRTVIRPAGVLIIRGSESGRPDIEHRREVRAGELPGPAYPMSVVAKQREATSWAAGERHHNRGKFGFEPTDADSQAGNATEFLLSMMAAPSGCRR